MKTGLFLLCFLCSTLLKSEITADYSIEWIAHQSEVIFLSIPIGHSLVKGEGSAVLYKSRFKITRVLKGEISIGDTLSVYSHFYEDQHSFKLNRTDTVLVFARVARNLFKNINGRYIFSNGVDYILPITRKSKIKRIYTSDFKRLQSYDQLLKLTLNQIEKEKQYMANIPNAMIIERRLEIPMDSEIFKEIWQGSTSYLIVPQYTTKEMR